MTAILERRESTSLWARFCEWITSTENRIYIGWFGVIMVPTLLTAASVFIIAFIAAPPVDIDGIREPVSGSLLYGNNIITGAVIPTSNAIGLHFYPIWEAASLDEWLYNGGPYQLIVCHFFLGVCCYMGREWELSFRLGMRPWIAVAYSAPVAAATAVFIIYPIGQGSFSDGMPLGKLIAPTLSNKGLETCLNGETPSLSCCSCMQKSSAADHAGIVDDDDADKLNPPESKRVSSLERLSPAAAWSPPTMQAEDFCKSMQTEVNKKDNPVPNRIQPRKQPGLYMIRCIINDFRYYGESNNVSSRLASHRSSLNRKIHTNMVLQHDFNQYGLENFDFVVIFMGPCWENVLNRRGKETELIILDRALCYNILETTSKPGELNPFFGRLHTPETKKKISDALKGIPNDLLGRKVFVNGNSYPSIAEASRQTGEARKTIRKKVNDASVTNYYEL